MDDKWTHTVGHVDAIGSVLMLNVFGEQPKSEKLPPFSRFARIEKVHPRSNVGRNSPCPCGSGKKSKRCCRGGNGPI